MIPLRIIWDNRDVDGGILTASGSVAGFPVACLQDVFRKRVWRSTALSPDPYVTLDKGASYWSRCVAIINHNLTKDGQIRVQLSNEEFFVSPVYDVTHDAWEPIIGYGEGGYGRHGYGGVFPESERAFYAPEPIRIIYHDPVQARYARVTFIDPANPAGYVEAGRLFLGNYESFKYQFGTDWNYGGIDDSQVEKSAGGQSWIDVNPLARTLRLPWEGLSVQDQYWNLIFFIKNVGISNFFVVDPYPDGYPSQRFYTAMYVRLQEIPELTNWDSKFSEVELTLEEVL